MTDCNVLDEQVLEGLRSIQRSGSPSLLERLVRLYEQESAKLLSRLRDAIEQHDAEQIFFAAHSFKSVSGSVGAQALAALCAELELQSKGGDLSDAPARLAGIEREHEQAIVALAAALSDEGQAGGRSTS